MVGGATAIKAHCSQSRHSTSRRTRSKYQIRAPKRTPWPTAHSSPDWFAYTEPGSQRRRNSHATKASQASDQTSQTTNQRHFRAIYESTNQRRVDGASIRKIMAERI